MQLEPSSAIDVKLYTTIQYGLFKSIVITSPGVVLCEMVFWGINCKALQGSILATVLDILHTHDLPNNSILHLSYIAKGIFVAVKARES